LSFKAGGRLGLRRQERRRNGKGVMGIGLWGFISLNWSAGMEGEAREREQARRYSWR
jgi:hypothetical protein